MSVRKAKHIIPVRDAIKQTLRSTGSSPSLPRPVSQASGSVPTNELSFLSATAASTPPPITPPPPPPLHSPQPIYGPASQISQQSVLSAGNTATRLFASPYFRSQFLQHLHFGSGRRSAGTGITSSTLTTNADPVDQSNVSTMKSYLSSSAGSGHSGGTRSKDMTDGAPIVTNGSLKRSANETAHRRSSSLRHPSQRNSTARSSSKSAFGTSTQRESRRQRAMAAAAAAANRSFRRPIYGAHTLPPSAPGIRHSHRRGERTADGTILIPNDAIDADRPPSINSPSPHSNDRCDELNCSKFGAKSSGYDRHSSYEKSPVKPRKHHPRTRLTRQYWEEFLAQRLFLFINCALFCVAMVALVASCILDPRPLHHLSSRGGFFAFNSCIALTLALLGLYGVQRRQRRLLQAYATFCGCLLGIRLTIALAMLPSLSQFSLQLIALMCIALIELLLMLFATHLAAIVHKLKRPPLLPDQTDRSTTTGASGNSAAPTPIDSIHVDRSALSPPQTPIQTVYNERPVDVMDQMQDVVKPKSLGQDNPAFHPDALVVQSSPNVKSKSAGYAGGSRRGLNYSNNLHQYSINYDHLLASSSASKSPCKSSFSTELKSTPEQSSPVLLKSKLAMTSNSKPVSTTYTPTSVNAGVSYPRQSPVDWQQVRSVSNRPLSPQLLQQQLSNSAEPPHSLTARSRHASGAMSAQSSSLNASPALFRRDGLRQSLAPESPQRSAAGSLAGHSNKGESADSGRGESRLSTQSVFHSPLSDIYRNTLEQSNAMQQSAPKSTQQAPNRTSIFDYNYTPINLSGLTSSILQKQTLPNSAITSSPKTTASVFAANRPSPHHHHQRNASVVYTQLSNPNVTGKVDGASIDQKSPSGIATQGRQQHPQHQQQPAYQGLAASSSGQATGRPIDGNNSSNNNTNVNKPILPATITTSTTSTTKSVYSNVASSRSQIQINRMNFLSSNQQQTWANNNNMAIVKSVLEEEP